MSQVTTFIDEVAGFSAPVNAALAQRSVASVTVSFKGGQTVSLDMTDARHRNWGKILESEHHYGRPVYVEMDASSSALRGLLFPIASTVAELHHHTVPSGLEVGLTHSSCTHWLRSSHPRFAEFAALLSDALQQGSSVLVTGSADSHEIIDVRATVLPEAAQKKTVEAPRDLARAPLTPVSPAIAAQLFALVSGGTCAPAGPDAPCIPFMYPDDGCWARAHEMCRLMLSAGQESQKVWIKRGSSVLQVDTSNHPDCSVMWGWHVAPVLAVSVAGNAETWVVDPSMFPGPVPVEVWAYAQHSPDAQLSFSDRDLFMKFGGPSADPDYTLTEQVLARYRNELLARFTRTEGPPYSVCYKADLFLRDNLDDDGLEPLPRGGISCSPDINHFREELADPQATLGSASAKARDDLFERAEYGQPNYIYVRLQNRGAVAADANIDLYYSLASSLPTPSSWHKIGSLATASPVAPGAFRVAGPLLWDTVPQAGHYCFVAVVDTPKDPKPDLGAVHSIADFYDLIRRRNNVTWKNFDVENFFADSTASYSFLIRGWPGTAYLSDLELDTSKLPADAKVELRLLKRLTVEAILEDLQQVKATKDHVIYKVTSPGTARVRNVRLRAGDQSAAIVNITTQPATVNGVYQFALRQLIQGNEVGRVTQRLNIGKYLYMGNRASLELHLASCDWAKQIGPRNKVAFDDTERAIGLGYNGCIYCLPELNTDT